MKQKQHNNFMTEKEKNYIAHINSKNIQKSLKYKNYAQFFNTKATETKVKTKEKTNEEDRTIKQKETFQTIGKTFKKSKKLPRLMVENNKLELSRTMTIKLALEELFDKVIARKYCNNVTEEIEITEEEFFYFLEHKKFYKLLILLFEVCEEEKKREIFIFLMKYGIKIQYPEEFKMFVNASYINFPKLERVDFEDAFYFNNFYFNICNVILGSGIIKRDYTYVKLFYQYLCDDSLELVFSLDDEVSAWKFLTNLIMYVDDKNKGVVVGLIKDRVLETVEKKNPENLKGLEMFLDAIGLEKDDLV
ncbi:hypothetical protein COBT_000278 [Conglomerata obtusa]